MSIDDTPNAVHHDFYDLLKPSLGKKVKVFYLNEKHDVEESIGIFEQIIRKGKVDFIEINYDELVRIDRIITINGRPGPAFDDLDTLDQACLASESSNEE